MASLVFEELLDNFSMKALGGIVIAVVLADAITRTTLGEAPVLQTSLQDQFSTAPSMFVALPLGLAAGLIGHSFTAAILKSRELFSLGSLRPELNPPSAVSVAVSSVSAHLLSPAPSAKREILSSQSATSLSRSPSKKICSFRLWRSSSFSNSSPW